MRTPIWGSAAVATLTGGVIAAALGPSAPFAIGGALQVVAAIWIGGALVRRLAQTDAAVDLTDTVDIRDPEVVETV